MERELLGSAFLVLLSTTAGAAQTRRLKAFFAPDHIGAVKTFALGPGGRTVYAADQDVQGSIELYNAPSDGSAPPIRLAVPGMPVTAATRLSVSPDGQWLVYQTDAFGGLPERNSELFRVPMDGSGSPLKLSGTLIPGRGVATHAVGTTHVVYHCDELTDEKFELFSAPLDGSSASVRISGTLVAGGEVEVY